MRLRRRPLGPAGERGHEGDLRIALERVPVAGALDGVDQGAVDQAVAVRAGPRHGVGQRQH